MVSGPPGSGKTSLAGPLAHALHLPLFSKDTIKQALLSVLDVPDVASSQQVGRASVAALLAVAAENGSGVLESVWHRSYAVPDLARLPGPVVEVFCRCDRDVAEPVAGGWPVLEVDTNVAVDVAQGAGRVLTAMADGSAR